MSLITLTVNQPYGSPTEAPTTPVGGGWTAGTISIKVVAWQTAAETDVDMAGFQHGTEAFFNGIVVANNDKVVISNWTPPTRPYDHLSFYYQVAGTFNVANSCTKCTMTITEVSETNYTLTITNDNNTDTITFGAATSVELNPVVLLKPTIRESVTRGWNGLLVRKNNPLNTISDVLEITCPMSGTTAAEYDDILKWIRYSVPVILTDSAVGAYNPYVDIYTGMITNTTYIKSPGKNNEEDFTLTYMVESEIVS